MGSDRERVARIERLEKKDSSTSSDQQSTLWSRRWLASATPMGWAKKAAVAETTARVVDQAVAYVLMAAALAVTYLVH